MKISFIGFGKAGKSLARYFKKKGHDIRYIYDINRDDIVREVVEVEGKFTVDFDLIKKESEIIFIAVPDSKIEEVWKEVQKSLDKEKIVIHLSGAKEGIYEEHNLYALHPAAPMTGSGQLDNVVFGLENNGEMIEKIKDFIEDCGNKVVLIKKGSKSKYHLANVMVSNLVLSLFQRGVENLISCGIEEEEAISLLLPLAKLNLQNIENRGIKEAVTGPVQREDFETIQKHLEVIESKDKDLYKNLSANIQNILGLETNKIFL